MLMFVLSVFVAGCNPGDDREIIENASDEQDVEIAINREIELIAEDFLALQPMRGFPYQMSVSEAYLWQDRIVEYFNEDLGPVIGYKTGGHSPGPGFATFPAEGIRGAILEKMIFPSGTSVTLDQTKRGFLEADFAFRVGSDSINDAQSALEVLAGLDAIIPFAEIPDPYYEAGTRSINGTIVSNMGSRMGFAGEPILVSATEGWLKKINNFTFAVHDEHGNLIDQGTMAGWYKPLQVVIWLRDQLLQSGKKLRPGDLLSLGNIGILRQLHENSPRGPAYRSDEFILSYYGLADGPAKVVIRIDRSK
jgi:2-keto-4-pentenoate hydratase